LGRASSGVARNRIVGNRPGRGTSFYVPLLRPASRPVALTARLGRSHTEPHCQDPDNRGAVQHILALSHSAVTIRHWFEINLDDASMEHGARIEIRELARHPHRGTESASQLTTVDRPMWRSPLFVPLSRPPRP